MPQKYTVESNFHNARLDRWFKSNVKGGKEIFNALTKAVASAEKRASSAYKKDL